MTPRSRVDTDLLARRRLRLITDYRLLTHSVLDSHGPPAHWLGRTASRWSAILQRQFLPHYFGSPPRWRIWIRNLRKARALPDFCIIGPIKSGTSDLAVTIMSHPNVLCPLVKEFRSTDPLAWKTFYPTLTHVHRHARQHGVALCPFVGPYLHCLDIPIILSSLRPNTKIIINLRNPSELVFSEWKWTVLNNKKQLVDRLQFLKTFPAYVDKLIELFPAVPAPLGRALHFGIYAPSVAQWLQSFGETNLQILDISDYFTDRNAYLTHVESFLGLPHVPLPHRLPIANANPLDGLAAPPETCAKLRAFFEPYNMRLWDVIGKAFPW